MLEKREGGSCGAKKPPSFLMMRSSKLEPKKDRFSVLPRIMHGRREWRREFDPFVTCKAQHLVRLKLGGPNDCNLACTSRSSQQPRQLGRYRRQPCRPIFKRQQPARAPWAA